MENKNGQTKQNQNVQVLVAGFAGLIAGAAGVTVLALSDKDIRKKVGKKAKELKTTFQDWSTEKLQIVDHQNLDKEELAKRVIDNTKEDEPLKQEVKMKN